jgi:uncharacterized BrkB/YihY/UPF0761 family membrane protein
MSSQRVYAMQAAYSEDRQQPAAFGLLLVLLALGAVLSVGVFLKMMDIASCGEFGGQCDAALLDVAQWITPAVAAASCLGTLILIRLLRHRDKPLWWIPLVGCALTVIAFVVSVTMISSEVS